MGWILIMGGARPAGVALLGSAVACLVAYFPFAHGHFETLVLAAVILGTVGLTVGGLAGLIWGAEPPLDRYGKGLSLVTAVGGALAILRIHMEAAQTCYEPFARPNQPLSQQAVSCFRGFENPWVQALLAFNVAFLAFLFLVQTRWSSEGRTRTRKTSVGTS